MENEILRRIRRALEERPKPTGAAGRDAPATEASGSRPDAAATRVAARTTVPQEAAAALDAGIAPPPAASPSPARLVSAALSREELEALFLARAESSGAIPHRVRGASGAQGLLAEILPAGCHVAFALGPAAGARLGVEPAGLLPPGCSLEKAALLDRDGLFRIGAAVTAADAAIAETGSIILAASNDAARLVSLAAEIHIALVWPDQIEADLLDWAAVLEERAPETLPEGFTLITGPSKTADIEIKLVVGVHGPAALHLVLVEA